jgi:sugar-specific transcriptional regulator TrmB
MSHERVIKTLTILGLSQTDANVYIYLATNGPQKAEKIGDALKLKEQLLYQSIEKLKGKGVVSSIFEQSDLFSALPFDQTLELLVKVHLKDAQTIEQYKDEILSKWKKITKHS